jgi:hypothetical protein
VELESDCSTVVEKINSQTGDQSVIAAIIHDIKEAMGRRQQCSMKKIRRHQNQIAHNLAQYGIKSRSSKVSFSFVPFCIQDLICNERQPCQNLVDGMKYRGKVLIKKLTEKVICRILCCSSSASFWAFILAWITNNPYPNAIKWR